MTTDKIHFTKEKETMLMTLSGRAIQSQWKNPILRDPWAEEAMRHIDYDLSKQLTGVASWSMWKDIGPTIIATRAATFDLLTTRFLADHPDAVVLQVGCGMDSRAFRVDPPAGVEWFDVDYPDVIDLRRQLFPERDALSSDRRAAGGSALAGRGSTGSARAADRRGGAALLERNGSESAAQCGGRSLPQRSDDLRYLQFDDCEKSGLERRGHGRHLQMGTG